MSFSEPGRPPESLLPPGFARDHAVALCVAALVLFILAPFWKLAIMQGIIITDDIFTSDITNAHLPYFYFMGEALRAGTLPLWMPQIYGGYPFFAGPVGLWYPLNTLAFWILPTIGALNVVLLLTLITAAVGMFFYTREIGSSIPGSLVAGMSFAFSGFMIAHLKHVTMVESACWFPLGLLAIERGVARSEPGRSRAGAGPLLWLAPIFAVQMLSGFVQVAYYSGLVYAAYLLVRLYTRTRELRRNAHGGPGASPRVPVMLLRNPSLVWFVIALALGAGMSAISLVPGQELVHLSRRAGGVSYSFASDYAYNPSNILTFVYPYWHGDIGNLTYSGESIFWEDYGYAGLVTLLLAVFGLTSKKFRLPARFFAVTAVLAYFMVLGSNTPVFSAAFHVIPGLEYFRFPTRFLFVVDASLAVLASVGLTSFVSRWEEPSSGVAKGVSPGFVGALFVILAAGDLIFFQMRQNPIASATAWMAPPESAERLAKDTTFFRIYSPGANDAHKFEFFMSGGWEGDLKGFFDQREFLQVNSNLLYGFSSADGYIPLTPEYVSAIWGGDVNTPGIIRSTAAGRNGSFYPAEGFDKLISLFNVKYILCPLPVVDSSLTLLGRFKLAYLYENRRAYPRAFVVYAARVVADPEVVPATLISSAFDPSREALVPEDPGLAVPPGEHHGRAEIVSYDLQRVEMRVQTDADGLLVFSDTWYPGWKVRVDGREEKLLRVNECQRGAVVPRGTHTVVFEFSPPLFTLGASFSGLSLLLLAGCVVLVRRAR